MSAAAEIVRRSDDGLLLRYRTDLRGPHHGAQRVHRSDRLKYSILRATRDLGDVRTILECTEDLFSDVARERFWYAFRSIEAALELACVEVGA